MRCRRRRRLEAGARSSLSRPRCVSSSPLGFSGFRFRLRFRGVAISSARMWSCRNWNGFVSPCFCSFIRLFN